MAETSRDEELKEILGMGVGEASTLWEELENAGIFKAQEGAELVEKLFKRIKKLYADVEEKAWMYDDLRD